MSLIVRGDSIFKQSGAARWNLSAFGLDTLYIPFQGSIDKLEAYESTLQAAKWSASALDGNMYLSTWTSDEHKQHPTITLVYIGCRGGSLTNRTKRESEWRILSANYHFNAISVDVSYMAPAKTVTAIAVDETPPAAPTITAAPIFIYGRWKLTEPSGQVLDFAGGPYLLNYFTVLDISVPRSDELVPALFFQNSITKMRTLIPFA